LVKEVKTMTHESDSARIVRENMSGNVVWDPDRGWHDGAAVGRHVPRVSVDIPGHGRHTVTAAALDDAMTRYLPNDTRTVRAIVNERTASDYSDVTDLSALLIMLADFDHNVDDSPLRVY
jgi:hypothetical protein